MRVWILQIVGTFEILTQEYYIQKKCLFFLSFFLSIRAVLEVLWKGEINPSIMAWARQTVTRGKVPAGKDLELHSEAEHAHMQKLGTNHWGVSERPLFLLFAPGVTGMQSAWPSVHMTPPHYDARGWGRTLPLQRGPSGPASQFDQRRGHRNAKSDPDLSLNACSETLAERMVHQGPWKRVLPDPQSGWHSPLPGNPPPSVPESWVFNVELQRQNSRLSLLRTWDCFSFFTVSMGFQNACI